MDEAAAGDAGQGTPYTGLAIAWARTGDGELPYRAVAGGAELVVRVNDFPAEPLYTLLVNGHPEHDLEDWPAAWVRPGPPPHVLRQAAAAQVRRGRIDAIVVAAWAGILCELPRAGAGQAVAALGLPGTVAEAAGCLLLRPPPPGTTRLAVAESRGDVSSVEVTLAVPVAGRPDFDALLGPGSDGPRVHCDQPYPVCYRVTVTGAPYTCDLFAAFDDLPGPAQRLTFRRQPG